MDHEFLSFALGRSTGDTDASSDASDAGSTAAPSTAATALAPIVQRKTARARTARAKAAVAPGSPFGMVFTFGSNAVSIGRDPHDIAPPGNWARYDPRYIAILYLKLGPKWDISVNHASYLVDVGEDARLAKALEVITEKLDLSRKRGSDVDFGDPAMLGLKPYKRSRPASKRPFDSGTFKDFTFKSQNEIFIFLHHPGMNIRTSEKALIGLKSGYNDAGRMLDLNTCFFHARTVSAKDMPGLAASGTLIRLENYATDQNGELLKEGDEDRSYSLDIMFQVNSGSAGWITMVVDPDTGNGTGYQP